MILFLVSSCKHSVSVASETSEAESVRTAEVQAARLSTEAKQKVTGLAS